MYICVKLSHSSVQQRLAQHCKSSIPQLKKKKFMAIEINQTSLLQNVAFYSMRE